MKLYHFNPHTYSVTWTVMAESREAAIAAVQRWVDQQPGPREDSAWSDRAFYQERLDLFVSGACGRTIEVYEPGQVVQGEIS